MHAPYKIQGMERSNLRFLTIGFSSYQDSPRGHSQITENETVLPIKENWMESTSPTIMHQHWSI